MNQGVKTIIYPVKDIAKAKAFFSKFLGVEPYADQPYYVGYKVGNQDIGLDPNGHKHGVTPYYEVADIKESLEELKTNGGTVVQDIKDVGGGKLTAIAADLDGNIIGLTQNPK